jgi:hypothetical protein
VITCNGKSPVGSPSVTSEGLNCEDNSNAGNSNIKFDKGDFNINTGKIQLKAGSKRHQHIVGFEDEKDGQTRFSLVALDLPAGVDNKSGSSD